ncbi:MAG: DUF4296 domain-containing protein, partial [Prevotella sp.]|nr:DUF4296 domain-containing protein [Prevotella sp.]
MSRFIISIFLIVVFFSACSRRPGYVIPEKKMVDVLYDIQIAQALFRSTNQFASVEKKEAVINGILRKHKVTQVELDSSLFWYSDNIKIYIDINDAVTKRLKADNEKLTALRSQMDAMSRDWSNYIIPPFYYLTESSPILSFSIDSAKLRDINLSGFNIRFDVQGL